MTREDAVLGAFLQVTFHELGHGVFEIYDIPMFGREEDAADQMAGFILAQFGEGVARRTLPAAAYLWQKDAESSRWRRDTFSDEHGHPLQRAYNYMCMAYGAAPGAFQYYVDKGLLPKARAANCKREFEQITNAFVTTMTPHIDRAKMKVVQSREWLLPQGSEAVPSDQAASRGLYQRSLPRPVMRGLDPRIHRKRALFVKAMDCRVKPGNDLGKVNVNDHWY